MRKLVLISMNRSLLESFSPTFASHISFLPPTSTFSGVLLPCNADLSSSTRRTWNDRSRTCVLVNRQFDEPHDVFQMVP